MVSFIKIHVQVTVLWEKSYYFWIAPRIWRSCFPEGKKLHKSIFDYAYFKGRLILGPNFGPKGYIKGNNCVLTCL